MSRATTLVGVLLSLLVAHPVRAQLAVAPPPEPEVRADVIFGHQPAVQVGGGVQLPFGYYVRLGLDAAVGLRIDDATRLSATPRVDGRADVLVRFLLDPFRQTAYGLSLGGGMSVRAEPGDRLRPLLLAVVELEGRRRANGWVPAVQVGLGGGVRLGLILRRASRGAR